MKEEELKVEETVTEETLEKETEEAGNKKEKKVKNKDKEKIAELEKALAEKQNDYLKVYAEMANTKRRLTEENVKDRKYAAQSIVSDLINPIDMLVKIVNMEAPNAEIQNYLIGFQMITNQIVDILKTAGLTDIKALGEDFNPNIHHAVSTEEVIENPNKVLEVLQTGYMFKDRVLRPALVKVSVLKEDNKKEIENKENFETQGDNIQ